MVQELERYVSTESGTHDKAAVDRVGTMLSPAFEQLGFTVERVPQSQCGDHLIARHNGRGKGRLLMLIHLDTVWPTGTIDENPFRISNGSAYGPGVADMKGGWVVLLSALRALRNLGWNGLERTTVFMTGDEEQGSPTGRPLIERESQRADWVLVMEPARESGALVVERGMVGAVYLEISGRTAHTGNSERGASAIEELAHKVIAFEKLTDRQREVLVNVGLVSGGSARQVIPDRAFASIDVRAPNNKLANDLMGSIQMIAETQYVSGTSAKLSGGITRPAFDSNSGTEQLFELAQKCGQALGIDVRGERTRAGSDGNFSSALGVPTLDGLGPQGANVCSREENLSLDSLAERSALLAGIVSRLPGLNNAT